MHIATWNVNSIRLRIPQLKNMLVRHRPDIIALQETKVQDHDFPLSDLQALGYPHIIFRGQKSYNGVALLSRMPLIPGPSFHFGGKDDARHISCMLPGGGVLHNFYVPAGGDVPDRDLNPKYDYKIKFLHDMKQWLGKTHAPDQPLVVVGDINIAPLEHDVWNHKQMLKVVCHTPLETETLKGVMESLDFFDAARSFVSAEKKLYSWWSYRNMEITAQSRGLRLDHIWLRRPHQGRLRACWHLEKQRLEQSPSDHVAVLADIDI